MNLPLFIAFGLAPWACRIVLACAKPDCTFSAQILADSNRDGLVNELDLHNKTVWSTDRGAIFLPNLGDRYSRCPVTDLTGRDLSNEELAACNDASGDTLLEPRLAAPLQTVPLYHISSVAVANIYVAEPVSAVDRVRLFWQTGSNSDDINSWTVVNKQVTFNATSLRQGIKLAIDSRELVTDASIWDGAVTISFKVTDRNCTSIDYVTLRQAPVLLHHHLQNVETVLVTDGKHAPSPWQGNFVRSLQDSLASVPQTVEVVALDGIDDIWAQDFLEPGYANMPGPNGTISLRVLLRSAQSSRKSGRQIFKQLRGPGVGAFQPGPGSGFGWEEVNSGGNFETIPPYVSRSGISYPNGRVVTAKQHDRRPAEFMITHLNSQGAQPLIMLEAGWLAVGHVDEMVQFLPYNNKIGFTIAVADTEVGLRILQTAQDNGFGSVPVLSYEGDWTPDPEALFIHPELRNMSIDALLADQGFVETNRYAQGFMDKNLKLLLDDIPLAEADILRVPVLWRDVTFPWPDTPDGLPRRVPLALPGQRQVKSFFPEAINGLVLGHEYLAPNPFGPIIKGRDIFAEAITSIYGKANMNVHFIDDYMSHHVRGGEVHCATNSLRNASTPWVVVGP